ncbi:MAG: cytochrome C [Acidobacteria bacterium]|nr:cytochrome C [Acidobacteriota bacterium]
MVFRTLPIEYDSFGRARLRDEDAENPYLFVDQSRREVSLERRRLLKEMSARPGIRQVRLDPVTRTVSRLAVDLLIDFNQRQVLDARLFGVELSPFEMMSIGRRASEAVPITSRTRGGVSGGHAIASALALEMAGGVAPPPLAVIARNLGACGEIVADSVRHLFLLAGPDYSEPAIRQTNPSLWQLAQSTRAPGADLHRCPTIADLMSGLTINLGSLYLEALHVGRLAAEVATLLYGKSPHPSTIFPCGNGTEASRETFNLVLGRINALLDYAKVVAAVWDDLVDFLGASDPHFLRLGTLPANLISFGLWDEPEVYTATYRTCNEWGERRLSGPGVIVNGENIGLEEFVDRTAYDRWEYQRFAADPANGPISPLHPWNKETRLSSGVQPGTGQAIPTWLTAPRWDREAMECGPLARLWINSAFRYQNCEFIAPVRSGLEINIPKGAQPARRLSWSRPEQPAALERLRATAYQIGYAGMVAFTSLLSAFECLRRGETRMSNRFTLPDRSVGVGLWECASGSISHHLTVREHHLTSYQINGPAEWLASSRDSAGLPGVIESALINTPLVENTGDDGDFSGIDLLRVVRSFAP